MSGLPSRSIRYSAISEDNKVEEIREQQPEKEAQPVSLPIGLRFVQKFFSWRISYTVHQYWALLLTFLIYVCYHASRRPLNVVKPILSPYNEVTASVGNCTVDAGDDSPSPSDVSDEGWEPFTGKEGERLLVGLDFTFLLSYAIGVMLAGRIADRSNLRHYLLCGMVLSGIAVGTFGMGYFFEIHHYSFYIILQILTGFLQASGWPAVVAIVAQWFGKENLGLIMGLWNAHASVGNSVGSALSASVVKHGWGSAFLLLGGFISGAGILFWFFLVPQPSDAGFVTVTSKRESSFDAEPADTHGVAQRPEQRKSISWFDAVSIPGVIPFSIALFFSKFVAYTFLFWLPYYIASICINGRQLSAQEAGDFSILFDIGGIAGGAFAGIFYDMTRSGAAVSVVYGVCSIPLLLIYNHLGRQSLPWNIFLLILCGFCVNGPYALITTAVSAALGTHESIAGNERALSTVAAIIDGMGSLGAALGPTLTGQILSTSVKGGGSFDRVFIMLAIASLFGVLTLVRVAWIEIKTKKRRKIVESIEMENLVRKPNSV